MYKKWGLARNDKQKESIFSFLKSFKIENGSKIDRVMAFLRVWEVQAYGRFTLIKLIKNSTLGRGFWNSF